MTADVPAAVLAFILIQPDSPAVADTAFGLAAENSKVNRRLFLAGTGIGVASLAFPLQIRAAADPSYRASDVELIAAWLLGQETGRAFEDKFHDSIWLADGKDVVAYTDVAGVKLPKGLRPVPYDFIQARLESIRRGGKNEPGVVVTGSVAADPPEESERAQKFDALAPGERCYHVEVAIGNMAWHWRKVLVAGAGEMVRVRTIRAKVS